MAMIKQAMAMIKKASYQYQIVKVLSPIKIKRYDPNPEEFLGLHVDITATTLTSQFDCAVVYYQYPDKEPTIYKSLNQQLDKSCSTIGGQLIGLASLTTQDIGFSVSQIKEYSDSRYIRGFALDCRSIATCSTDYKEGYPLLELCSHLNKPVLLTIEDPRNPFEDASVISQALCQIISDGIFDSYPNLKIVIETDNVIPQIMQELTNNNVGTSVLKHSIEHYLKQNVYCVSNCSDELYVQYLVNKLGDNQILFGATDNHVDAPAITSISQLSHQKLMGLNARCLFSLKNDRGLWKVNMDKVTVINQMRCIDLLSSKLRDESTDYKDFMVFGDRLMNLLAEEALARVPAVIQKDIVTPTGIFRGLEDLSDKQLCVVSVIRSGDILLEAVRKLVPGIRVGKILIQRDEGSRDKRAVLYYHKLPKDIADCYVLLVDPMLATGGSMICATDVLIDKGGVDPKNIMFVNLFCVEEGLQKVQDKFPEIEIVTLSIDDYMNEDKYIVPGVGDFGDRYYGTNH